MNPTPPSEPTRPTGLLLTRDLFFTSKITSTAQALGLTVHVAGNHALAAALIQDHRPRVVFLDLAAAGLTSPAAIQTYRQLAPHPTTFIAFGSHVDSDALDAARAAGCDTVLPRRKFSAELPTLLNHHLGR
ncbi:MAG: hypothetical protein KatS3mg108_2800 [Isosphaeraceae bacterium]|jgi:CheY-like chemotaxis protein|nr:MAG: hypothetical protein KatS3mg108_2800 [Isosphaeraceae bacterium]